MVMDEPEFEPTKIDKLWVEEVFSNTEVKVGNPLDTKDGVIKMTCIEPEDVNMDKGVQKTFRDKHPELIEIDEDFGIIELENKIRPNYGDNIHKRKCHKDETKRMKQKERKTYALVVDAGDQSYEETLKSVKTKLRKLDENSSIEDEEAMEKIQKQIQNREGKTEGSVWKLEERNEKEYIHIRGVDAFIDIEEVKKALSENIQNINSKNYKLSELRPASDNTQVITLTINKIDAESLLAKGTIKIGLVRCKLKRRVRMNRCYRCWGYDHLQKGWNEPKSKEDQEQIGANELIEPIRITIEVATKGVGTSYTIEAKTSMKILRSLLSRGRTKNFELRNGKSKLVITQKEIITSKLLYDMELYSPYTQGSR
ncbi:unnamed protein product [Ceutorhynchus assimilis]|uniref:Uncharacterized protein n=1 Tax=Ceutorhynchus assimilis TaxID=467358 RepID=A0A9N9MIL0_9CUCU|nr:unnamed protein product [Ceutorhynchus assimilis]